MAGRTWGRGAGPGWKATRLAVLKRAEYRCQIADPRCAGTANVADHITPLATLGIDRRDPRANDLSNLQAACTVCHDIKSRRESATAWANAMRAKSAQRAARLRLPVTPHPGD